MTLMWRPTQVHVVNALNQKVAVDPPRRPNEPVWTSVSRMHREVCPTSPSQNSLPTNATVGTIAPSSLLAVTLCDGVRPATYDFCRHGGVADHALSVLDAVKIANVNPNTRKDLKNNSKVFAHKADDLTVCEEVFRLGHGLSKTSLKHGRKASLNNLGSVPKRSRTGRAIHDHNTDETKGTEREQQTLERMKEWVEHHGCKQPDSEIV